MSPTSAMTALERRRGEGGRALGRDHGDCSWADRGRSLAAFRFSAISITTLPRVATHDIVETTQLVAEYKKSGEFDRLRREMLSDFQRSEAVRPLLSRVEDIARQKLQADRKLEYLPQEAVHRELIAELDRYPLVERAVGEFRARSDRLYPSEVRAGLKSLLRDTQKRVTKDEPVKKVEEPTKPPVTVAAGVAPPVHTEEQMKMRDVENVKGEGAKKNEDEDAMDVEQTSAQPPPKETTANKHASEYPPDQSTPTDGKEAEASHHIH
ncbi:hypothetical protein BDM02DRAFT_3126507 [Thelephora ganbajun]|uniref:Uncharacterized protein n=1 Tax=Thelephora ganbajun TaxID=370292 RepID=A0ACB6ZRP6_THEGA|nr:hypothetical protein BDM02DRAFT_3126507 [Thelephora ganbajun]